MGAQQRKVRIEPAAERGAQGRAGDGRGRCRSAPGTRASRRTGFRGHRAGHPSPSARHRGGAATERDCPGPSVACACGRRARYAGRRPKTFTTVVRPLALERALLPLRRLRPGRLSVRPRPSHLGVARHRADGGISAMTTTSFRGLIPSILLPQQAALLAQMVNRTTVGFEAFSRTLWTVADSVADRVKRYYTDRNSPKIRRGIGR